MYYVSGQHPDGRYAQYRFKQLQSAMAVIEELLSLGFSVLILHDAR